MPPAAAVSGCKHGNVTVTRREREQIGDKLVPFALWHNTGSL